MPFNFPLNLKVYVSVFLFIIYAVMGSFGLTLMKKGMISTGSILDSVKSPLLIIGFAFYVASFLIWLRILKDNKLTMAFPIASAALFICITIFSALFLDEHFSFVRITGMLVIIIGIIIVSKG